MDKKSLPATCSMTAFAPKKKKKGAKACWASIGGQTTTGGCGCVNPFWSALPKTRRRRKDERPQGTADDSQARAEGEQALQLPVVFVPVEDLQVLPCHPQEVLLLRQVLTRLPSVPAIENRCTINIENNATSCSSFAICGRT
jgi:hypothetical protein